MILSLDDDVDITTVSKIGLEDNGFVVDTFNDPVEALSNFKADLYNLSFLILKCHNLAALNFIRK
jgi:DNA-binding response OmpR family regulator